MKKQYLFNKIAGWLLGVGMTTVVLNSCTDGEFWKMAPEADFTISEVGPPPCEVTFTNTTKTNGLPTTYSWAIINGIQIGKSNDASYTFNTSGTYTVKLTANNRNGTHSVEKNITVLSQPLTYYTITFQTLNGLEGPPPCDAILTNAADTQGLPTTYVWPVNGTQIATTQDASYTFTSPGLYIVRLTATNSDVSSFLKEPFPLLPLK